MKEAQLDLITNCRSFDAVCVTTNGERDRNGLAIMGRGIALAAKQAWPGIVYQLAQQLRRNGNVVSYLGVVTSDGSFFNDHEARESNEELSFLNAGTSVFSFPTKNKWRDKSKLSLIEQSTKQLVLMANKYKFERVCLPRPGCQNGGLLWEQVRPVLTRFLDDRFTVVSI